MTSENNRRHSCFGLLKSVSLSTTFFGSPDSPRWGQKLELSTSLSFNSALLTLRPPHLLRPVAARLPPALPEQPVP
jgi:hypothetical protein